MHTSVLLVVAQVLGKWCNYDLPSADRPLIECCWMRSQSRHQPCSQRNLEVWLLRSENRALSCALRESDWLLRHRQLDFAWLTMVRIRRVCLWLMSPLCLVA